MSRAGPASGAALLVLLGLAGCQKPAPVGNPRYVLGEAWRAEGVWHYPSQSFELNETGLAAVYGPGHPRLTANGEGFDPAGLTGAHQTLQLPAIVRLTHLDTGAQMLVRINDRGPANPARMLAVTPRVAALLEFPPDGVARVRLEVLQSESRDAAEAVQGGDASRLEVATAPRPVVRQEALTPTVGSPRTQGISGGDPPPAMRAGPTLAETVRRVAPAPGALWLRLGSFSRAEFARMQLARIPGPGARIETIRSGRSVDYRVIMGPYSRVSDADAALARVSAAGMTDGRIVSE